MKRPLPLLLCGVAASVFAAAIAACSGSQHAGTAFLNRLSPNNGSDQGGETVLVTGSDFGAGPASVLFDGVPATQVQVLSNDQIRCVIPAHPLPGGVAVLPVKVEVRSSGRLATQDQGFEYVASHEAEPPDGSGVNDSFASYELIPLDADFQGHIGSPTDVDILHMHPPSDGQVLLNVSFTASYTSGGLAGINVGFFHGPDPTPNPDAYLGGVISAIGAFPGPAPSITHWLRMAYLYDGHGPFLKITGVGDGQHGGFDPINAYTVHVTFVPDASVETAPQGDDFFHAAPLPTGSTQNASAYDQDYDWYAFSLPHTGWMRLTVDGQSLGTSSSENEVELGATLFRADSTDPDHPLTVTNAAMTVGDPGLDATPYAGVLETVGLSSNQTYYLRLVNKSLVSNSSAAFSYPIKIERGDGSPEQQEPSGLPPAETEFAANDVGSIAPGGNTVNETGYFFHEADKDWFSFTTTGTSNITVTLDVSKLRTQLGDYDVHSDPLGIGAGVQMFDSTWFADPAHLVDITDTVGSAAYDFDGSGVGDPNLRSFTINSAPPDTYYVLADALTGMSLTSSYSLSFTSN